MNIKSVAAFPLLYLKLDKFEQYSGISAAAVRMKIHRGVWAEGEHFRYDPDGNIQIIISGYHRWVESGRASKPGVKRSESRSPTLASVAEKP